LIERGRAIFGPRREALDTKKKPKLGTNGRAVAKKKGLKKKERKTLTCNEGKKKAVVISTRDK